MARFTREELIEGMPQCNISFLWLNKDNWTADFPHEIDYRQRMLDCCPTETLNELAEAHLKGLHDGENEFYLVYIQSKTGDQWRFITGEIEWVHFMDECKARTL